MLLLLHAFWQHQEALSVSCNPKGLMLCNTALKLSMMIVAMHHRKLLWKLHGCACGCYCIAGLPFLEPLSTPGSGQTHEQYGRYIYHMEGIPHVVTNRATAKGLGMTGLDKA